MSLPKPVFGSILVTVIVLALALIAGNAAGGVQAAPPRAPAAQQAQGTIGEVSGTAVPGDKVSVTQGDALIGETTAGQDGTWRVPIPASASATVPFHVQIVPVAQRGAQPEPEGPVSILVSVIVGATRVDVRVQVISPNGQVDIEVSAPINPPPCECDNQGAAVEAQPTAQPTAEPLYHRVRAGETLRVIAARYGVTTQAIMDANRLRNPNLIFVGQRLLIPKP